MNSNTCLIWAIWRSSTPRLLLLFWFLYAVQTWSSSVGKKNKMSENALMWLTAWDESRHEIFIFVDLPSQRRRCGHFGDVPAVCECPLLCPRCKGSHLQVKCEEPTHQCITCCKPYEVTYILCPYLQQEHSIPCVGVSFFHRAQRILCRSSYGSFYTRWFSSCHQANDLPSSVIIQSLPLVEHRPLHLPEAFLHI